MEGEKARRRRIREAWSSLTFAGTDEEEEEKRGCFYNGWVWTPLRLKLEWAKTLIFGLLIDLAMKGKMVLIK